MVEQEEKEFFAKVDEKVQKSAIDAVKPIELGLNEVTKNLGDLSKEFSEIKKELSSIGADVLESKNVKQAKQTPKTETKKSLAEKIENVFKTESFQNFLSGRSKSTGQMPLEANFCDAVTVRKSTVSITNDFTGDHSVLQNIDPNFVTNPLAPSILDVIPYGGVTDKPEESYGRRKYYFDEVIGIGENADAKPVSFKLERSTAYKKRISAELPVSKDIFVSLPQAAMDIANEMPELLNDETNFQTLWGDGQGDNLLGLFPQAQTINFAAKAYAAGAIKSIGSYNSGAGVVITFTEEHGLTGGETITFAGATETSYNAAFKVKKRNEKKIVIDKTYIAESEADVADWTASAADPQYQQIEKAQYIDVIKTIVGRIRGVYKYNINTFLISHDDMNLMSALKDTTAQYIIANLNNLGIRVIANESIPVDSALCFEADPKYLQWKRYGANSDVFSLHTNEIVNNRSNTNIAFAERQLMLVVKDELALFKFNFSTVITALKKV